MVFTDNVKFYKESNEGIYNPDENDEPVLITEIPANVTDLGIDRQKDLFGDIDNSRKVIRLIRPIGNDWSYLTINDDETRFKLISSVNPLKINGMIVGESHE